MIGLRMIPHLYDLRICMMVIRHRKGMIKKRLAFLSPVFMPFRSIPLKERYTKKAPIIIPRNNFFNIGIRFFERVSGVRY
jgi:hypothetical protein